MTSDAAREGVRLNNRSVAGHALTCRPLRSVVGALFLWLFLFGPAPLAWARQTPPQQRVTIAISKASAALQAAEWVEFDTLLRNDGGTPTPRLTVHLSIAALVSGQHVDPEDWSPQRTQHLPPLQPGESVQLSWRLHALFEGAFAAFVTIVSADAGFPPAVSPSLQLDVTPDSILPLREVVPVAVAVPFFPLALLLCAVRRRRRRW